MLQLKLHSFPGSWKSKIDIKKANWNCNCLINEAMSWRMKEGID